MKALAFRLPVHPVVVVDSKGSDRLAVQATSRETWIVSKAVIEAQGFLKDLRDPERTREWTKYLDTLPPGHPVHRSFWVDGALWLEVSRG